MVATINSFCVDSVLTVNDAVFTMPPDKFLAITYTPMAEAIPESEG